MIENGESTSVAKPSTESDQAHAEVLPCQGGRFTRPLSTRSTVRLEIGRPAITLSTGRARDSETDWLSNGSQAGSGNLESLISLGKVVSRPGIEPGTRRLRVCCSAN